jgi:YtxH-like protein
METSEREGNDMKLKDIRDTSDLRELNSNDVVDLLDELRGIATKRGAELLDQGRAQARKAIGAPRPGAVGIALVMGVAVGALVGAVVALLMTPVPGREARQRLAQQVDQVRERMPEMKVGQNGRVRYRSYESTGAMSTAGSSPVIE